jgi:hypothetical protein
MRFAVNDFQVVTTDESEYGFEGVKMTCTWFGMTAQAKSV